MIVIPFFLEGHRKTTFAAGFWVLWHWWYALPQGWYNLSLDVGELWKVTQTVSSHLYTILEEDRGRWVTMQMSFSERVQWRRGQAQRLLWTSNKKVPTTYINCWICTAHSFLSLSFIHLLSWSVSTRQTMFYSSLSMLIVALKKKKEWQII